jgi:hypothetical protein
MNNIEEFEKPIKCIISECEDVSEQFANYVSLIVAECDIDTLKRICRENSLYLQIIYNFTDKK